MRFRDFLRTAVLLFGGAATALAAVSVVGAGRNDDSTLVFVALGWWLLAARVGLWMGRGAATTAGIARLLAGARRATALPEFEPGTMLFNRLWPLAVLAVAAGGARRSSSRRCRRCRGLRPARGARVAQAVAAVAAIEGRDGVRVLDGPQLAVRAAALVRVPGLRKIEPERRRAGAVSRWRLLPTTPLTASLRSSSSFQGRVFATWPR